MTTGELHLNIVVILDYFDFHYAPSLNSIHFLF